MPDDKNLYRMEPAFIAGFLFYRNRVMIGAAGVHHKKTHAEYTRCTQQYTMLSFASTNGGVVYMRKARSLVL